MTPLVSVCIPTYNNPKGLQTTLDCITGQTYKNLEIIVSIDCSVNWDNNYQCVDICDQFKKKDPRVSWTMQLVRFGAGKNYKYVRDRATGKYLMFAQDDDWRKPESIEAMVNLLEADPQIPFAVTPSLYINESGRVSPPHLLDHLSPYNAVGNGDLGFACMGLWRRELYISIEAIPEEQDFGADHTVVAHTMLAYGKPAIAINGGYVKGYREGSFMQRFERSPWFSYKTWWWMMGVLFTSGHIPTKKKLVLPVVALTNFARATAITGVWVVMSMPDNPLKRMVKNKFFGAN